MRWRCIRALVKILQLTEISLRPVYFRRSVVDVGCSWGIITFDLVQGSIKFLIFQLSVVRVQVPVLMLPFRCPLPPEVEKCKGYVRAGQQQQQ